MKLYIKTKKTLLISIGILLLVILSLFSFIYFKQVEWKEIYKESELQTIQEYFYEISEDKYLGTFLAYEIEDKEESIKFLVSPPSLELEISIDKGNISTQEEIETIETEYGNLYPIFLIVNTQKEDKNIIDKGICIFRGNDYCKRELSILDVSLHENTYPYPTLTEVESKEFALFNIENSKKYAGEYDDKEIKCLEYMSEYLVSEDGRESLLKEISEANCNHLSSLLLYSNLLPQEDSLNKYVQEVICLGYSKLEQEDVDTLFSQKTVGIFNKMCDTQYVLSIPVEENLGEDLTMLPRELLLLLNSKEEEGNEEEMDSKRKLIMKRIFTSISSPSCSYLYICNLELINLSKVILSE
jgi:hypothetical protein